MPPDLALPSALGTNYRRFRRTIRAEPMPPTNTITATAPMATLRPPFPSLPSAGVGTEEGDGSAVGETVELEGHWSVNAELSSSRGAVTGLRHRTVERLRSAVCLQDRPVMRFHSHRTWSTNPRADGSIAVCRRAHELDRFPTPRCGLGQSLELQDGRGFDHPAIIAPARGRSPPSFRWQCQSPRPDTSCY